MIEHLKKIHDRLYLPSVAVPIERSYDIAPIKEPYLYASSSIVPDEIDEPRQVISIPVRNVGGGTLKVNGIEIDKEAKNWLKRRTKTLKAELSIPSECHSVELTLHQKKLLETPAPHAAHLKITSNSISDTFSAVQLQVNVPENDVPILKVPERVSFGEITVWKLSIRQEEAAVKDFYLAGDFDGKPPKRFCLQQTGETTLHACLSSKGSEFHYDLELNSPGIIAPKTKKNKPAKLKYALSKFSLSNTGRTAFSGEAEASVDWLHPSAYQIEFASTKTFALSANIEQMQLGRNFGWLNIADKKIEVWAWVVVKGTVGQNEDVTLVKDSELNYEVDLPANALKELPLETSPHEIYYDNVPLFEDVEFSFPLFNAQHGYLVGDFNDWESGVLMMEKRAGAFFTTLSLSDGTYCYRYELDGEMRFDPTRLNEVIFCSHGFASRADVNRYEQTAAIHNNGKDDINLLAYSSAEWLSVSPASFSVPHKGEAEITVKILPNQMEPGLNVGEVELITGDKRHGIPVSAMLATRGVVPILEQTEFGVPNFAKGQEVTAPLKLKLVGAGTLTCAIPNKMIQIPNGKIAFHNDEPFVPRLCSPELNIHSGKTSRAYCNQLKAFLITNCYLANRRVFGLTYRYQMAHLITEPRGLYFPRVFLFGKPQRTALKIKRSDGEPISPGVDIPEELKKNGLLDAVKLSDSSYEFILNPKALHKPGVISGFVEIRDENSKMTEPVRFAANAIASSADITVDTIKTIRAPEHEGLNLSITNRGDEDLKIFSLQFEERNFICVPRFSRNTIIPPGETIHSTLKIRRGTKLLFKTLISDTLLIHLSDAQYRGGIFRRDVEVTVPAKIFSKSPNTTNGSFHKSV